jgi:hypothetical protein
MKTLTLIILALVHAARVPAQIVLYDFESATAGSGLPLNLTVSGLTAQFTASGLGGFYIQQPQNTILVTPVGFSGNALIPSSVYGADLHIGFSRMLNGFSILYAPQELACDSSATMRVTAYMNGTLVGTTTTNAQAGTWPSETLQFNSTQGFNSVVIHYDKAPVTGGDYGVIFVADNVTATLAPEPPLLYVSRLANQIQMTWPTNPTPFSLQWNTNLLNTGAWLAVTNTPVVTDTNNVVTVPIRTGQCYYRLKWP